jgi:hypothetical protein
VEINVSSNKLLTLDDLVMALINEVDFRNAAEPLALYHTKKLAILKQLFGCDLQKRGTELDQEARRKKRRQGSELSEEYYEVSGEQTIMFLENCINAFRLTKSPFRCAFYLEGMPPKVVRELEKEYGEIIRAHERELNQINRVLIGRTLKYLFPGIEKKKIPEAKLFERGLPKEAPDPDDFW